MVVEIDRQQLAVDVQALPGEPRRDTQISWAEERLEALPRGSLG
jgi:hypothetical protein